MFVDAHRRRIGLKVSCGALALMAATGSATAQTALPEITIEGATLARPRAAKPVQATPAPSSPTLPSSGQAVAPVEAAGDPVAPETGGSASGVAASSVGSPVSVVTGEELRSSQIRHAADALRSLPGVSVNRTAGFGSITQVRIRGFEANHTLVLIDGIVANNTADGEFDFSNLSAEEIERIEVIRGPMSGIYGSNATAGVVNIVTRRGQGPLSLSLKTEIGSFATRDVAARLAGGNEKAHIAVAAAWRETNGFNIAPVGGENDGARLGTFSLTAGGRITPNATLDVTLRHIDKRADRDGFGGAAGTFATAIDESSTLQHTLWLAGTRLRWDTFDGKLTHELRASHNSTTTADSDVAFGRTRNESVADSFSYVATYRLDMPAIWAKHEFSALGEKSIEQFTPFADSIFSGDGIRRDRSRFAFAGEWRGTFAERLVLSAGVRHDDNDAFRDFTTWKTSASLLLREWGLRPHASVGTGVKLPSMFEQFGASTQFFQPNPNLKPEESFGWDAGVEWTGLGGRAVVDVTYFKADLQNKIVSDFSVFPSTVTNVIGTSHKSGVEVALRYALLPGLTLGAAYTYLDTQDANGVREIRRPRHAARVDASYLFLGDRAKITAAAIYNGSMTDFRFLNTFFPDPTRPNGGDLFAVFSGRANLSNYWLVNLGASYKIAPGVEMFGRVENLLNTKYQEVLGFDTAGIAAYAGVKVTFDDIAGTAAKAAR
jgi:vitamin B12 transporter